MDEHRRGRLRWWLCRCGDRFPCGAQLRQRDPDRWAQDGAPRPPQRLVGWNIQGGLR